jgi:hypothetical protein
VTKIRRAAPFMASSLSKVNSAFYDGVGMSFTPELHPLGTFTPRSIHAEATRASQTARINSDRLHGV